MSQFPVMDKPSEESIELINTSVPINFSLLDLTQTVALRPIKMNVLEKLLIDIIRDRFKDPLVFS